MEFLFNALFTLLQFIGRFLFDWYGWVLVVGVLLYLIFQNRRRARWISDIEHVILLIEIPKDNEKQELSAEQMFASLHGILRPKQDLVREGSLQEHLSFEIISDENRIRFYVWTPKHLQQFVEGQIYAQYPTVQITEVSTDYAQADTEQESVYGTELTLSNNDVIPIRTFKSFEVDPLAGITAVLAKLEEPGEKLWTQILARPIDDNWHQKGEQYIKNVREGKLSTQVGEGVFKTLSDFMRALWTPPSNQGAKNAPASKPELSDTQKDMVNSVNEKIGKLGYEIKIRIVHQGPDRNISRLRIQSMVGAFKQFNDANGFKVDEYISGADALQRYKARLFTDHGNILNIEELASLYHLPHKNVETPNMVWATTKTAEPPSNLPSVEVTQPEALSPIGMTNFRGSNIQFGLKRSDRPRHVYVVGQTGTGKSYLMELLTLSDMYNGQGFAVIDPHGDFATDVLRFIPPERVNDVVYFNPTDTEYPIAFNPLEVTDPALKGHISSEIVGVLARMFGYSWGPRLEYILRYTILALLDYPNATLLGITRMLTEKGFRKKVIKEIHDPVVKNFWVNEFASWNEKFASEAVAPVLNKVGAFTANPLIRNIIGQPKSSINLRAIMDEGKILVVNLSRGQVGEDNAATLGALMVTKIQLAAMSRASLPGLEERRPFYLYVDEFQNFATSSFAVILSEARKYGLNLTIANQYVAQLSPEVRDAVFGNVGTMITFRIGADDAQYMSKYFQPIFEANDLVGLHNRHFIISMSIDGEKAAPFTATSLNAPKPLADYTADIIELSRQHYARDRVEVEKKIERWTLGSQAQSQQQPRRKQKARSGGGRPQEAPPSQSNRSDDELRPDEPINLR